MNSFEKIKLLRKKHNWTQTELAERTGYSDKTAIAKIEKGKVDLPQSKIKAFALAFGVAPSTLLDDREEHILTKSNHIPIVGTIACGQPIFAEENIEGYFDVNKNVNADFCLYAKGDSMIGDGISNNDIVFVKSTNMVDNGKIAVVLYEDNATLKHFYYYKDKNLIILKASNSNFEDIIISGADLENVKVQGECIGCYSNF